MFQGIVEALQAPWDAALAILRGVPGLQLSQQLSRSFMRTTSFAPCGLNSAMSQHTLCAAAPVSLSRLDHGNAVTVTVTETALMSQSYGGEAARL